MNYKIKRTGKKVPNVLKKMFRTYDEARSAIRKWLRVQEYRGRLTRSPVDLTNRTITIGEYGFSVARM